MGNFLSNIRKNKRIDNCSDMVSSSSSDILSRTSSSSSSSSYIESCYDSNESFNLHNPIEQTEQTRQIEQTEQIEQTRQIEQTKQIEQTEQIGFTGPDWVKDMYLYENIDLSKSIYQCTAPDWAKTDYSN